MNNQIINTVITRVASKRDASESFSQLKEIFCENSLYKFLKLHDKML